MTTTSDRITSDTSLLLYHVYTLTNPIDDTVFYVGCSINTRNRLYSHVAEIQERSGKKGAVIKSILKAGVMPRLDVVDSITAADPLIAHYVEQYWILHYRDAGATLVNKNDATPSWNKTPPYSTIEFIKSIGHLPLDTFSERLTRYYMTGK